MPIAEGILDPEPEPPKHDAASDLATFERLAALSPAEYDRVREREARRLRIRARTLDAEVAKVQNDSADIEVNKIHLPEIEPWPEPVNGAEVVLQVYERFVHYMVLPPGAADVMSVWSVHTHALAAFTHTPRLHLNAIKGGCGKSTALDILRTLVPRPMGTENLKPCVVFRAVTRFKPTLLLDELDTYITLDKELRGLLCAGTKEGGCAYRCEGGRLRAFQVFAAAALAGIGELPATLQDRSIMLVLHEAEAGAIARFNSQHTELEKELGRKIARWAKDNFAAIKATDPVLPRAAYNRLADNWRALFAIAQVLGGEWPGRILEAFMALAPKRELSEEDLGIALLSDIRLIFLSAGVDRLSSSELTAALLALPERPWRKANEKKPINETWLGRRVGGFGIAPGLMQFR